MEEMLININPETGRLHEKSRNAIQAKILAKLMIKEGLSVEDEVAQFVA